MRYKLKNIICIEFDRDNQMYNIYMDNNKCFHVSDELVKEFHKYEWRSYDEERDFMISVINGSPMYTPYRAPKTRFKIW